MTRSPRGGPPLLEERMLGQRNTLCPYAADGVIARARNSRFCLQPVIDVVTVLTSTRRVELVGSLRNVSVCQAGTGVALRPSER